MSIEEIINGLDSLAQLCHNQSITAKTKYAHDLWNDMDSVAAEALALLKTHPEAQPNEPLTLEELRKMDGQPVWVEIISDEKNSGWWFLSSTVEFIRLVRYPNQHFGCLFEGYGTVLRAYRLPPKEAQ